jgi:hypothetical protein
VATPATIGWVAQASSLSVSFGLVTFLTLGLVGGAGVLAPARTGSPSGGGAEEERTGKIGVIG